MINKFYALNHKCILNIILMQNFPAAYFLNVTKSFYGNLNQYQSQS